MRIPFLIGEKTYLRPLERDDLNEKYLGWINDPEVNQYLESGRFPYTMTDLEQFYASVVGTTNKAMMAVVEKSSNNHIGNVKLDPINWVHRTAVFGILIGDKSVWGQGFGTEATRLTVEYAFYRLNLHKVSLGVLTQNKAGIKIYERVGFVIEGTKHQEYFLGGQYVDALWMGLLRENYDNTKVSQ